MTGSSTSQTDESYYVGFDVEGQHVGLLPGGGPQGLTAPVGYWQVPDIEANWPTSTATFWGCCRTNRLI